MKTKIYKILYFFCVSVFVFVCSFHAYSLISWADVPSSAIVTSNTGNWTTLPFTYIETNKYYTIQDPSGIPSSTYLNPIYFYNNGDGKFYGVNGKNVFTYVLNNLVGIVADDTKINSIFSSFLTAIGATDSTNNKYVRNCLYDSNDNFLGICLNDISGCYYAGYAGEADNAKDDGNYVPNLRSYIDYADVDIPVYFTFYGLSDNYIVQHLQTPFDSTQLQNYQQFRYDYDFIYGIYFNRTNTKFYSAYNNGDNYISGLNDVAYCIAYTNSGLDFTQWNNFCSNEVKGYEVLATDLMYSNNYSFIYFSPYDSNNAAITSAVKFNPYNNTQSSMNVGVQTYALSALTFNFMPFNFEKMTFYRDPQVRTRFDSETYYPEIYYTDSFNNYDASQDHSINAPITQVNQSVTYNNAIYDNAQNDFYNYYDNGTYDQSSSTTNITNITNNYYTGGGDNPNDPDNPEDPDDPDNPDDPSDVLSQILQALLRFFTAIGSVLGTILAGLLSIFSEILESIATVTEDLTGISDFFGSIFAWLPDPVPQVLGLGFSICVLCGIIKFIRG